MKVLRAMQNVGFQALETEDTSAELNYNQTMGSWFPKPYEQVIPLRSLPAGVKAMENIGFQALQTENISTEQNYNQAMSSYFFLQWQEVQGQVNTT